MTPQELQYKRTTVFKESPHHSPFPFISSSSFTLSLHLIISSPLSSHLSTLNIMSMSILSNAVEGASHMPPVILEDININQPLINITCPLPDYSNTSWDQATSQCRDSMEKFIRASFELIYCSLGMEVKHSRDVDDHESSMRLEDFIIFQDTILTNLIQTRIWSAYLQLLYWSILWPQTSVFNQLHFGHA